MERYDPAEKRGFHGRWIKVGASAFAFDGPPGGAGHELAVKAVADAIAPEPGGQDIARDLRAAADAMVGRDMAAANRHLDGAAYLDGIYSGGSHRDDIEAIRRSFKKVPKGAVKEPVLPGHPPGLEAKGKPVPAGVTGTYVGAPATGPYRSLAELLALDEVLRKFNPREPMLRRALTHEPLGKPGGPGLWGMEHEQLPAYIQHIAKDLMEERGMPRSRAIATAVSQCKRWCAGGENVHPDTRAKACAAIAEWERLRAKAHATRSSPMGYDADGLDESWDDLSDLPDMTGLEPGDFAAAAAGDPQFADWAGGGDVSRAARLGSGARFAALKAKLAGRGIRDPGALAAHIGRKKYGKAKFHALASAARKRKSGGPAMAQRTAELSRQYPLEECRIMRAAEGREYESGRVVEAYAAIFGVPAVIRDKEGHYEEEIHRAAFNEAITAAHPDRNGGYWNVGVLYNHGLTVHGTPAERFSLPPGVSRHVSAEDKGLLTRTEYADTPLGEELLELVNLGALRTQSFTGGIIRSDPMLRGPGDKYRPRGGVLTRVRRLLLGLREYGLTPFPAYTGAEVLGVRMTLAGGYSPDLSGDEDGQPEEWEATGGSPGDEPSEPSTGNRLWRLRTEEALARAGIVMPTETEE